MKKLALFLLQLLINNSVCRIIHGEFCLIYGMQLCSFRYKTVEIGLKGRRLGNSWMLFSSSDVILSLGIGQACMVEDLTMSWSLIGLIGSLHNFFSMWAAWFLFWVWFGFLVVLQLERRLARTIIWLKNEWCRSSRRFYVIRSYQTSLSTLTFQNWSLLVSNSWSYADVAYNENNSKPIWITSLNQPLSHLPSFLFTCFQCWAAFS